MKLRNVYPKVLSVISHDKMTGGFGPLSVLSHDKMTGSSFYQPSFSKFSTVNIYCFCNIKLFFEQVFKHILERNKSSAHETLRWDRNGGDGKEERYLRKGETSRFGNWIVKRENLSQWSLQIFCPGNLDGWQCHQQ